MTEPKAALVFNDFLDDAKKLNCKVIDIMTVFQVESKGYGFDPEGFPKTLFEGHIFHRLTKGVYDAKYPDLSYPVWTKKFYKDWKGEKDRLNRAIQLDREAAIQSASWGAPQILGLNWKDAGCDSLQHFVNKMCQDSNLQLECFTSLILSWGLDDELRTHNWVPLARRYNGSGQVDYYAGEMEKAYKTLLKLHGNV